LSAITPDTRLPYGTAAPPAPSDAREGTGAGPGGLTKSAWVKIGVITFLLCAIFWPNLRRLWEKTNPMSTQADAANWQHAIVVPLIGLFYLYVNREQLLKAPVRSRRLGENQRGGHLKTIGLMFLAVCLLPAAIVLALGLHHSALGVNVLIALVLAFANTVLSLYIPSQQLGFLILVEGLAVAMFGIYPGRNDFVWDLGMVITIFGVVLMLTGWDVMKTAWFPIAFLICALPWPGLVYSWVAGPLQMLAAKAAVVTLRFTGVEAVRSGTKMLIMEPTGMRTLNVAEACAGLRSLMTFITVGAAVAFLSGRPLWQKIVITLSAIPIAILCNVMRVTGQGLIDHYWRHDLAEGFAHQFVGIIMLIPAFFLILFVGWVLDHLFLEEVDDKERLVIRAARPRAAVAGARASAAAAAAATGAPTMRIVPGTVNANRSAANRAAAGPPAGQAAAAKPRTQPEQPKPPQRREQP
jgi:exosortase